MEARILLPVLQEGTWQGSRNVLDLLDSERTSAQTIEAPAA